MGGRKTGNVTTVKRRLRAHLLMGLIAAGATPLLLSRDLRAMENNEENLRGSAQESWTPAACSLYRLLLKSSLPPTVIPGHPGTVCPARLRTVVSWHRVRCCNMDGKHITCLAFHIRENRCICGIFLYQMLMSN